MYLQTVVVTLFGKLYKVLNADRSNIGKQLCLNSAVVLELYDRYLVSVREGDIPDVAPDPPPNKEQPADEIITPADRTALSRMRLIFIALFLSVRSSVGCVDLH